MSRYFPFGILGHVWYLIVLIPDLCTLTYFVCLLTNERYKTYQMGFSFGHLSPSPRVAPGGTWRLRGQKLFSLKFNQIWCGCYLLKWHVQRHSSFGFHPLRPMGGAKRSNFFKFQLLCQFQRFLNQTLCVLSQMKDIKHIRRYFIQSPRSCTRGGTFGC